MAPDGGLASGTPAPPSPAPPPARPPRTASARPRSPLRTLPARPRHRGGCGAVAVPPAAPDAAAGSGHGVLLPGAAPAPHPRRVPHAGGSRRY